MSNSQAAAWWFLFRGNELLVYVEADGLRVPDSNDLLQLGLMPASSHEVEQMESQVCFAASLAEDAPVPVGMELLGLRAVYAKSREVYRVANRGVQIVAWEQNHRFCGRCGTPTTEKTDERAMVCPKCGELFFPRLSPAIIVLIRDGDRALLARSHRFPPGRYSTVAGFVEPGETLEEAVVREVAEEVGVTLRNIRYFGSQPWPFPNSLMVGFTAEYAGGDIRLQVEEIADAGWFRWDQLPEVPPPMSIARRLIDWFVETCRAEHVS